MSKINYKELKFWLDHPNNYSICPKCGQNTLEENYSRSGSWCKNPNCNYERD